MSELQGFDQYFKRKMEDYSPPVPEHIWAKIEAEKDKKRPVPFLFSLLNRKNMLLVAALVVLVAGGIYTFTQNNKPINGQSNNITTTTKTIHDNNTTQNDKSAPHNQSSANGNDPKQVATALDSANKNINQVKNLQESKALTNPKKIDNKDIDGKNELYIVTAVNKFIKQKNGAKASNKYRRHQKVNEGTNSGNEDETSDTVVSTTEQHSKALEEFRLFKLLYYPEKDKRGNALKNTISSNIVLPPCPEIEKNAAGNKDYIEAYIGPDFAYKSYSMYADSASQLLLQKRKESISFRSAFSTGFRYTRVFGNGVSIRAGLNFSQVNEKFTYVQSNIVQVTYIIDPVTGDTTGSYISNGSRYKTTYNHYRTLDIPVLLGFETGNGRIHANLNAGVVINIRSWQQGSTIGLDSAMKPIIVNTGKDNSPYQYKTNIGAGFMTAASIYYKLNDRFHLLAEPYWRYNFSPMSKEAMSLQEKYSAFGLRFGLRMDLQY